MRRPAPSPLSVFVTRKQIEASGDRENEERVLGAPKVGSGTSPARTAATLALESFQSSPPRRKTLLHEHQVFLNPAVSKQADKEQKSL